MEAFEKQGKSYQKKKTFKEFQIGGLIKKTLKVQISNLNQASRFDEVVKEESETENNILSILDSKLEDEI